MSTVHRLLDDAFAGVPHTPEVQDLKEEIRVGLVERAAELEAAGADADEAARRAFAELGDVAALAAEVAGTPGAAGGPHAADAVVVDPAALAAHHRVRPRPGFVVGTVIASIIGAAALGGLCALTIPGSPWAADAPRIPLALGVVVALLGAGLVRGALLQETTSNHPLPARRATAWGGGAGLVLLGLGTAASAWTLEGSASTTTAVAGAALAVAGTAWLSWLGATQTNRTKAWVREIERAHARTDAFSQDPRAAARFGVYTVAIWTLAAVAAVVVGATAGWWWALLPVAGGFAVMMLTLARMLFGAEQPGRGPRSRGPRQTD